MDAAKYMTLYLVIYYLFEDDEALRRITDRMYGTDDNPVPKEKFHEFVKTDLSDIGLSAYIIAKMYESEIWDRLVKAGVAKPRTAEKSDEAPCT